jgi:hypothetical protein
MTRALSSGVIATPSRGSSAFIAAIDVLLVAGMAHNGFRGRSLLGDGLASVLVCIQAYHFLPIRRDIGVRFFALETLVGMPLIAPDTHVVSKIRCLFTGRLHCQYATARFKMHTKDILVCFGWARMEGRSHNKENA